MKCLILFCFQRDHILLEPTGGEVNNCMAKGKSLVSLLLHDKLSFNFPLKYFLKKIDGREFFISLGDCSFPKSLKRQFYKKINTGLSGNP